MDSWRKLHQGVPLDLSGATLAGSRLQAMDLGGCNLADADLSEADLSGANLFGANLVRARLIKANLPGVLLRKADLRKADLTDANLTGAELEQADLGEATLLRTKAGAANLAQATLRGTRAPEADFASAKMGGADLRGAALGGAILHGVDLRRANLVGADLRKADLAGADLRGATFREGTPGVLAPRGKDDPPEPRADLRDARLRRADLRETDLTGFDMEGVDLRDATLTGSCLARTVLRGADLGGAHLEEADLTGSDFTGVRFDAKTTLRRARVKDVQVDRYTLEGLDDFGGLTTGDRMQMRILDGVMLLRSHYSGFWQWIHLLALVIFVYPYAWFVFAEYAKARSGFADGYERARLAVLTGADMAESSPFLRKPVKPGEAAPTGPREPRAVPHERTEVPVWRALFRFIWNGGKGWETGYSLNALSFGLFCFSFLYNLTRFVMVFKTMELELHQEASGLPVPVSALGFWGRMVHVMEVGFAINVVVVLVHTFHFLNEPIVVYLPK
ncbi:MAG: pentapeptide repeat-containing protein [Planctomycetes bacterium]|nr:pentapeptide repeat-containing protein [Planctomycetota bacterium]